MALRSVIDIDINDASFQRFFSAFKQFQELAKKAPPGFQQVADLASGTQLTFEKMAVLLAAHAEVISHIATSHAKATDQVTKQLTIWQKIESAAKGAAHHTTGLLSRLGGYALRGGVGLALGVGALGIGSLFGLEKLAASGGAIRRGAIGLGIQAGFMRSIQVNLGTYFPGANNWLGAVGEAISDPTKRMLLMGAGVNQTKGGTGEVFMEWFNNLVKMAKATPYNNLGNILSMYPQFAEAGVTIEDLKMMHSLSLQEIQDINDRINAGKEDLAIGEDVQKQLMDFDRIMRITGENIKIAFMEKLGPVSEKLGELAKTLGGALAEFIRGIEPSEVVAFVDAISNLFRHIIAIAKGTESVWGLLFGGGVNKEQMAEGNQPSTIIPEWMMKPPWEWGKDQPKGTQDDPFHVVSKPASGMAGEEGIGNFLPGQWGLLNRFASGTPHPWIQRHPMQSSAGMADIPSGSDKEVMDQVTDFYKLPPGMLDFIWWIEARRRKHPPHSWAGAVGPFQFMPQTGAHYVRGGDLENFATAAEGAGHYIFDMYNRFHDWKKAVAAYNMNPNRLEGIIGTYGENWINAPDLPRETRDYIEKFAEYYKTHAAEIQKELEKREKRSQMPPHNAHVSVSPPRSQKTLVDIRNNTGGNAFVSVSQMTV